jgi:voltage-gated potassium channel
VVAVDAVLGTVLLGEFLTRLWISDDRWQFLSRPFSIIDVVVIATLLLPMLIGNLGFLRILRAVRLIRSLRVLQELRRRGGLFARQGELIASITNLVLFIFITSAIVYVLQADVNPGIRDFTDAVYFTVSALTTTGFGDITLVGEHGNLLSVVIMLVGISLFLKVAQAIFRPLKVHVECPVCGLSRHDPDAVHCKHCGNVIHIDTEGA